MPRRSKVSLLDSNVLLRFLLHDDPDQSQRARALMERLEAGSERAELGDGVVAETVWVLEKRARVAREEIARRLSALASLRGVAYRGKRVLLEALSNFGATSCDIVDCLLAARARSRRVQVVSFDHDFEKLACEWREPP